MTFVGQNAGVTATWGSGRPLSELVHLIGRRMEILHETNRDATVATAITVLQSLRKETRTHRGGTVRVKAGANAGAVSFAPVEALVPSYTKGRRRCLRRGNRRGARVAFPPHTVQLVPPSRDWRLASVYRVTLSEEQCARWPKQPGTYYVVAESDAACESYLAKRYGRIAARHAGLAKTALAEAMGAISTRPSAGRVGAHAPVVAARNVRVASFDGTKGYEVTVRDDVAYAAHALAQGRCGVDRAMKLAANRIAGRLRQVGEHILDDDLQTPFPEVKRRKR